MHDDFSEEPLLGSREECDRRRSPYRRGGADNFWPCVANTIKAILGAGMMVCTRVLEDI